MVKFKAKKIRISEENADNYNYNPIEKYILKYKRYPPIVIEFCSEFIPKEILLKAKPIILTKESMPSGRRNRTSATSNKRNTTVATKPKNPQLNSRTPAFVFANRMYWGRGVLNEPGFHVGNSFDLSRPDGMALFLHELFHVKQFYDSPILMFFKYIHAILVSLIRGGILWDHQFIPFERKAIKFEHHVRELLKSPKYMEYLEKFKKLQE
ncbi:MAG: hypothetical protein ACTSU2_06520 [Promethearchaeota archaeon]